MDRTFVLLNIFAAALLCAPVAFADAVDYSVTIDTSSINGTAGSLDFQFNPGPLVTQAADLQILNFASDGTLVNCASNVQGFCNTGDVSGTLPATLTFDNGAGFNDYFTGFTFGNTLTFDVSLYGPALTSPDGISTSGSTFSFSMFSDAGGTIPALTTDSTSGFAFTADVNLDGTTTIGNLSTETGITPVTSSVPEPSMTPILLLLGLIGLFHSAGAGKFSMAIHRGQNRPLMDRILERPPSFPLRSRETPAS